MERDAGGVTAGVAFVGATGAPAWMGVLYSTIRAVLKRTRWLVALLATGLMPHVASLPTPIVLPLWPGAAPGSPTDGGPERLLERPADSVRGPIARLTDIAHPTLQYFAADSTKATGAAVLVFPGGGYQYLAIDIEGTDICRWLTRSGIACVLVKYRVPQPRDSSRYEQPLQDAQRAIRLVRAHAAEWQLNPRQIGVIGFSAGGNVAAVMSNQFDRRSYARVDAIDSLSARPDFAMLVYPAYLTDDSTHSVLRPEANPSVSTPPTFMIQAENDPVGVGNVLSYARALEKAGVNAELHVYPSGGHGYGMRAGVGGITAEWPRLALAWMRALGIHSMEMPEVIVSIDDTVGRVSPLLFGANHRWGFEGFGTWDSSSHAATPSFLDAIDTSGIATIRFPGGTIANLYHWKRAIGPRRAGDATHTARRAMASRWTTSSDPTSTAA